MQCSLCPLSATSDCFIRLLTNDHVLFFSAACFSVCYKQLSLVVRDNTASVSSKKEKNAAQPQPEHLTHKMKLTSSTSAVRTAASDRQHETLAVNFTRGSKHSSMQHSLTGTPSQYSEGHSGILGNVGNMKHFLGYTALRCIKKGTQHKQQSSEHLHPHIWVLPIKNTLQAHPKILKV